jgi:hypothetical protein
VERLSVREKERIAVLVAEGAPFWRLRQEVPRSRYAIYRAARQLLRPLAPELTRSALSPVAGRVVRRQCSALARHHLPAIHQACHDAATG